MAPTKEQERQAAERQRLADEANERARREAEERAAAREAHAHESADADDVEKSKRSAADTQRGIGRARQPGDEANFTEEVMPRRLVKPDAFKDRKGVDLLMKACEVYGINPDPKLTVYVHGKHPADPTRPYRELLAWNFYPGQGVSDDRVVLVTAGGAKVAYPTDPQTEVVLRQAFNAFTVDPVTKQPVPAELPNDLTLPLELVLGIPITDKHILRRGYLGEGGKAGADRRDAADARGLSDGVSPAGQGTRTRGA